MIKVSDYIIQFLEEADVRHVFMLSGGMVMHLNDSLGYAKKLKPICMLHEQACTFAAESYARITNNLGVTIVTCGPGATNTVTGIAGAWIESTPLLVISGQCKRADIARDPDLRQLGVQEVKIVDIVKPITKYAKLIEEPTSIRKELEKALYIANDGRKGPVLLDIPVDVQGSMIDETTLEGFVPEAKLEESEVDFAKIIDLLNNAKRPVIYAGAGVSMAGVRAEFRALVEKLGIPVLLHWNGLDLLENDHPLYLGRPGAVGQRAANFVLQNADVLLTIGTRLALLQTGYNFEGYAKNAKHIMVDIDKAELNKSTLHPDIKVCMDAGTFIDKLAKADKLQVKDHAAWIAKGKEWNEKYPSLKPAWLENSSYVNSFYLMDAISRLMCADDIYVGGRAGTCVDAAIQAFKVKKDQRVYVTKGLSSMGNGLPAAIGGAYATGKKIVCVNGDGGFVMNIQELEVLRRDQLNIKLFVLNNQGYSTIRGTQTNVFKGHFVGCNEESGLTLGNIAEVAKAYGIKVLELKRNADMEAVIKEALAVEGPVLVDVWVDPAQPIEPRQASMKLPDGRMVSRPLEDMKPLLPPEEVESIMSVSRQETREVTLSVCMPTYNRGALLADRVRAWLAAAPDDFELVVSDNVSDNGTYEALKQIEDPRFVLLRNEKNVGTIENQLIGFAAAKGRYVMRLMDKDELIPEGIESAVAALRNREVACGVFELNHDPKSPAVLEELRGYNAYARFGFTYAHPSGAFFNSALFKREDIANKLRSLDPVTRPFSTDYLISLCLPYGACFDGQLVFVRHNLPPYEGIKKSFTFKTKRDYYFTPEFVWREFVAYAKFLREYGTLGQFDKLRLLVRLVRRQIFDRMTNIYRWALRDRSIREWYCIPPEMVVEEGARNLERDFFSMVERETAFTRTERFAVRLGAALCRRRAWKQQNFRK